MYDFVITICGHGDTKDQTTYSLTQCYEKLPYNFTTYYIKEDALIGRSRSVAATRFLKDHLSEYMIFIDTDMSFTPDELDQLYMALLEGYDIVAGSYPLGDQRNMCVIAFDGKIIMDGKVREIKYASTGFMGISRKALQTIKDNLSLPLLHANDEHPCYPFFESGRLETENIYISEDWDFCNKAREAGLKVYLHSGVNVDHVKEHTIKAEDVLKRVTIQKPSINVDSSVIVDLADFTGRPYEIIRNEVVFGQSADPIFVLARTNSYDQYWQQRFAPLIPIKDQKILDYGCGIGSIALSLSLNNIVVGYDIDARAIAFAHFRAQRRGYKAQFCLQEPDLSQFDILIFTDMFENIPDLAGFLKDIGAKAKRGTKIFHFDAFAEHGSIGHTDNANDLDQFFDDAGFIKFDNLWLVNT